MPIVMEPPDNYSMFFQKVIFKRKDLVIVQPRSIIAVIVKRRLVGDNEVCTQGGRPFDNIYGGKHRCHNSSDFLVFITGFYGVDCLFKGAPGMVARINSITSFTVIFALEFATLILPKLKWGKTDSAPSREVVEAMNCLRELSEEV
jgi:hypothetical protein